MIHDAVADPLVLEVRELTFNRGLRSIVSNLCFSLRSGEFLGIIGPNGGGKTTLLRLLLGFLKPSAGRVLWMPTGGRPPVLGYVPQRAAVDPQCPFSASEVVELGARGRYPRIGARRRQLQRRAQDLMHRVGLDLQDDIPFLHLSGGQQRRLLLARALMDEPEVLLLDEPTAGVDVRGQEMFLQLLAEVSCDGIAVVLVSHDLPFITANADRIACLNVSMHWHGNARDLKQGAVDEAYRCELDRYRVGNLKTPAPHWSQS